MQIVRKLDTSFGLVLDDGAKTLFLIFSAFSLLLCLTYQFLAVPYPYSLDYGEAPLVDQAMRLASGQNIYRADISTPPYTISNYPPLYVTLLAASVKLFGSSETFFVGRIISVLSAWISGICLILIVYALTRDRFSALSAGLIFLAFPFVLYWSPLLRIDMLALALSLSGLCLLVWEPLTAQRLFCTSLLLVAAIFTRQSYILAAPLAAFVWLLARDRQRAFIFAAWVGSLTLTLFLMLNVFTADGFYFNIVTANVNEFKVDLLKYNALRFARAALIPILLGVFSLFLSRRLNPLWTLATPYLLGSIISAATIGKIGSNVNYLLELCAALSLATGAVVAWSRAHLQINILRAIVMLAAALGVGNMIHVTVRDYTWGLRERRAALDELSKLEVLIADTPGSILADEYMGMLTLQGRPLVIQPFEVTQLAWAGRWDQTLLLDSINKKEFSAIIIYDVAWANERWTPQMLDAIARSYRLVDIVADNKIYKAYGAVTIKIDACPRGVWRLPSDGSFGIQWTKSSIDFFGRGNGGTIPVYAAADGLLTRPSESVDAVVILHDDPLRPTKKVWAYYGGMAAPDGIDSYIVEDFPAGISNVAVKSGQLLGYQGAWSGIPPWPKWVHMVFAVVDASGQNTFPEKISVESTLDPVQYLGLNIESGNENPQALKCE